MLQHVYGHHLWYIHPIGGGNAGPHPLQVVAKCVFVDEISLGIRELGLCTRIGADKPQTKEL